MVGKTIKYETRDGEEFDDYLTKQDIDHPLPGIIIITAIFGIDEDMIELSDAWASDGFIVSVPDIFWRVLPGPTADHAVGRDRMGKFDLEQGMKDIENGVGSYIEEIVPKGPSENILKVGDIILALDGDDVKMKMLATEIAMRKPNTEVVFTIVRDDELMNITVKLGEK